MPFRRFQGLLAEGYRLRKREQMMAIGAAMFPHMDEEGRKKAAAALEDGAESAQPEKASSTGDWNKLRGVVAIDRLQHPMRRRTPPGNSTDAQEQPRGDESE